MRILAIDTSTKNFSLAVADGDKILHCRNIVLTRVLSSSIIPAIDRILRLSSLSLRRIDGFAVGLGPGSFTSLRVGLATVKAFCFATGKPLVGISSQDVLAMNALGQGTHQICTICDAKRQLVYACRYTECNGKLRKKSPYLLVPLEEFLQQVEGEALFLGDAVGMYRDEILGVARKTAKFKPVFIDEKKWFPHAKNLIPLAMIRFQKKKYDNIDTLVPIYLYPHDCQIRR